MPVLLVGDARARPAGLEVALAREGFRVTEANDIRDAASAAPEVVLATLAQPDDVAGLAEAAGYAFGPATPLVVTLDTGPGDAALRALRAGAADVMTTPVNLAELCHRLRLRRRPVASAPRISPALDDALGLADELMAADRSDELLHRLCRRVARALELERCAFILTPPGTDAGRVVADETRAGLADLDLDLARYPEIAEARRTGEPVFVRDASRDPLFDVVRHGTGAAAGIALPRAVIAVPVRMDGDVAGVFLLRPGSATAVLPDDRAGLVQTLGRVGASVLRPHRNGHDSPRGGIASATLLEGRVREEVERARRYALGFSIVLLAVDDFAAFCGTHGRLAGERVLAQVAGLLRESFRVPDLVAAHGGEEFALLLPETAAPHAVGAVRRFRSRIATEFFDGYEVGQGPALAAGIAAFPHPSVTEPADLLALAAAALLRARTQEGERIAVTAA